MLEIVQFVVRWPVMSLSMTVLLYLIVTDIVSFARTPEK